MKTPYVPDPLLTGDHAPAVLTLQLPIPDLGQPERQAPKEHSHVLTLNMAPDMSAPASGVVVIDLLG
ncbi:MAG: hypothetical protein BMS9Abin36_0193 [Gammaproteobacteria bacterium]|nr:MAG: hypothetical protein BMS9Abin36_0193 [Gammaproteobacteria bacterium]